MEKVVKNNLKNEAVPLLSEHFFHKKFTNFFNRILTVGLSSNSPKHFN